MSPRHTLPLASFALLAALSSSGCENGGVRADMTAPSPISFAPLALARAISVQPLVIVPQLAPVPACPAVPPFLAPFTVVIGGDSRSDLFLNQVQMQFVDRTGIRGASVTVARPELVSLFGSNLIPRSATRSFPLSLGFGCVGGSSGTLVIVVTAADRTGREGTARFQVTVQ